MNSYKRKLGYQIIYTNAHPIIALNIVALSESSYVVKTISSIFLAVRFFSSSNTNQTGTTCGIPSLLTVVSFAVKVPCIRNFFVSFLDMYVIVDISSNFLKRN